MGFLVRIDRAPDAVRLSECAPKPTLNLASDGASLRVAARIIQNVNCPDSTHHVIK
jgi:hypothetical protein